MVDRYWDGTQYRTSPNVDDDTPRRQHRQETILRSEGAPAPDEDEMVTNASYYRGYLLHQTVRRHELTGDVAYDVFDPRGHTIGQVWTLEQAKRLIDAHIAR